MKNRSFYKRKHIMWIIGFIWFVIAALLVWKFFSFIHIRPTESMILFRQSKVTPNLPMSNYQVSNLQPSEVLNLTNWKITLPFAKEGDKTSPTEIKQPELTTYTIYPWFFVPSGERSVIFRAPVTGVTTSGSNYPRSELREMSDNGMTQASWSSTEGTHTMVIDEAITHVPQKKQQIVAGQIHDDNNDIIVIRLDYPNLYINVGGKNMQVLDSHYTLGKRFTVKFVVKNGETQVYYNNEVTPSYTLKKDYKNSYFKAGAYTQSNCKTEKSSSLCNTNNFGEVIIYNLEVTHQ